MRRASGCSPSGFVRLICSAYFSCSPCSSVFPPVPFIRPVALFAVSFQHALLVSLSSSGRLRLAPFVPVRFACSVSPCSSVCLFVRLVCSEPLSCLPIPLVRPAHLLVGSLRAFVRIARPIGSSVRPFGLACSDSVPGPAGGVSVACSAGKTQKIFGNICRFTNFTYLCTTLSRLRLFADGAIAQLVEQRTENPCVPGSIPGGTTNTKIPE